MGLPHRLQDARGIQIRCLRAYVLQLRVDCQVQASVRMGRLQGIHEFVYQPIVPRNGIAVNGAICQGVCNPSSWKHQIDMLSDPHATEAQHAVSQLARLAYLRPSREHLHCELPTKHPACARELNRPTRSVFAGHTILTCQHAPDRDGELACIPETGVILSIRALYSSRIFERSIAPATSNSLVASRRQRLAMDRRR